MRLPLLWGILLLLITSSSAEELSLEKAIEVAIRRNPALNAARWEVVSGQSLLSAAKRLSPPEALLAPALTAGGTSEELMVIQPLEINGARRVRARLAAAESALTLAKAMSEVNEVLADVALAYFEAVYRGRLLQIAREAQQNAEQTVHLVRQQIQSGVRPGIDLVQAEIEAERVRLHSRQREAEALGARVRLNTLLGYPQDAQHTLLPVAPSLFSGEVSSNGFSPEVVREQALLSLYQSSVEQIRIAGIPDLGVQLRVERWVGRRIQPGLGITISLPFLDHGARQKRLQAQRQLVSAQQLRLQATQQKVTGLQTGARLLLQAARERWEAFVQEVLPRAEKLAHSAQTGVETGAMSILQVLEAQRTVRLSREEAVEAELQMAIAWVESQRALGYFAHTYYALWKEERP